VQNSDYVKISALFPVTDLHTKI